MSSRPSPTTSDVFFVNYNTTDCGNIKLRSGKKLTTGDVYVLTIDTSDTHHVVLSTENITTGISGTIHSGQWHDGAYYDLAGRKVGQVPLSVPSNQSRKQILVTKGKKIIR